jgi:hypothetical protein
MIFNDTSFDNNKQIISEEENIGIIICLNKNSEINAFISILLICGNLDLISIEIILLICLNEFGIVDILSLRYLNT